MSASAYTGRDEDTWRMEESHPPIPGESLYGYVARVCSLERIPNTLTVTSLAGVSAAHRPNLAHARWDRLEAVAHCLRIDVAELQTRANPPVGAADRRAFFGAPVGQCMLELQTRWFSPASLRASAHHRALWTLRPFPFCEDSFEYLTNRCPDHFCRAVQGWYHATGIALCDQCGEQLSHGEAPTVDPRLRDRLRLAIGLVHPDPSRRDESMRGLPSELSGLDPGDLIELLCTVARLQDPGMLPPGKGIHNAAPERLVAAMAEAWSLIEGWPASIESLAGKRVAARPGRFGDGNQGGTLAFLARGERSSSAGLRRVFLELRRRFVDAVDNGVEIKEAQRLTGLRPADISRLRRTGVVGTVLSLNRGRSMPLISHGAIAELSEACRSGVPIEQAATALGISYHGVEQLLATGTLVGVPDPAPRDTRGPVRVRQTSLDALSARLGECAHPSVDDGAWLALRLVMRGMGGRLKPWGPVIEAMVAGRLRFQFEAGTGPRSDRISLHPEDADKARTLVFAREEHEFPFAAYMSKSDASEALNLHFRNATVVLAEWETSFSPARTVPVEFVERIASTVASPTEIAAVLGVHPVLVSRMMDAAGIPRVSPAGYPRESALSVG